MDFPGFARKPRGRGVAIEKYFSKSFVFNSLEALLDATIKPYTPYTQAVSTLQSTHKI